MAATVTVALVQNNASGEHSANISGEGAGIVMATLDLAGVASARGRIPALQRDRPFKLPSQMAKAAEE